MKKLFILIIKFYQKNISPLFPPSCRYYPTCSVYTIGCINRFGAFRGSILGFLRILRCNPLFKGGVDHVPEKFSHAFTSKKKKENDPDESCCNDKQE